MTSSKLPTYLGSYMSSYNNADTTLKELIESLLEAKLVRPEFVSLYLPTCIHVGNHH